MMNYILQITLQSPLTSSAGEGRIGLVDRDVAFDDVGLPILPGRRLKGLWREAYQDVTDAWQQCGQQPIPVDQVFGEPGQVYGDGDAAICVTNAELKEASSLKEWLQYLQHRDEQTKIQKLHFDDVIHHFAGVRAQTAINRATGSAKEDTLRLTRILRANLTFWARVYFGKPPNSELQNALALGAAALQHMGTARTRGLGKVRCCLLQLDKNGKIHDLTPVMNQNALPPISSSGASQSTQVSIAQPVAVPRLHLGTPTHLLRYRLRLTAAAVVPISDGDPNTVVTRREIPGSQILGAAAWHYLNQANHTAMDTAFRHAFLDGGLRFLTAYPEAQDTPQRLIPIPHSVRQFKDNELLIDLVEAVPGETPTKRLDRRYARISSEGLETQSVKTELNYHHARAGDRRKGRALGTGVPDGGAFFRYEAIQADQSFQGAVLGTETDLKDLQKWLQDLNMIRFGKSRSAQYGEAEFKLDATLQELGDCVEWNGFLPQHAPDTVDFGKSLIITTLSPLLTVNQNGHPESRFPERELAGVLGLDVTKLTLSASYTRTEVIGGYHAHLSLPRQQWPAIAPGSVFVFELKHPLDQESRERLIKLEREGLGLRRSEGYGRIAINHQNNLNLSYSEEIQLDDPAKAEVPYEPRSELPKDLLELLQGVVLKRCFVEVQDFAMRVAIHIENTPSNSLLGRLRLLLQEEPAVAIDHLDSLRRPAKESLTNCRINPRVFSTTWAPNTLYALFKETWEDPGLLTKELTEDHVQRLLTTTNYQPLLDQLEVGDRRRICNVFLTHLLTVLYQKQQV